PTVNVGDMAEVDGEVDEYFEMTQLKNVTVITTSSGNTITATEVTLPLVQADDYEAYEGMLVTFPQELTVNDVYDLGRYGSATLAQGGRLFNPTNVITPGTPANDLQAVNDLRKLVLDDGNSSQNPDPIPYPSPALSATNTLRSGDAVTDITGVLAYQYGEYKLHPTSVPNFVHENTRTTAPAAVSGALKVASFNVLNYFDTFTGCTGGVGGSSMDCRGADDQPEFDRQRAKIIDAILDIDADIVGLMEIENDGYVDEASAIDDLVDGLNAIAGAGTYAYINADTAGVTNTLGTDAIKVGLLYKPGTVVLTGTTAALNDSTAISGTNFYDMKNRPVLAQSFQEQATGEIITVLVNHLKSKGSDCDDAPYNDPDTGDGQGNCNLTRQAATEAMLAWLATDPTGVADADYLIIGDLNAYAMEDPIMTLQDGGFTNLLASYIGAEAYSYVYKGQAGYLDHALASQTLLSQITDATVWHINADEPRVLDYNTENKSAGQIISLYNADPYRASDHDPVVIGLALGTPDLTLTKDVSPETNVELNEIITYTLTFSNTGDATATNVQLTDTLPLSVTFGGFVTANGATETSGAVTWSGDVAASVTVVFTATVKDKSDLYGATVTNIAEFTSDNAGAGSDQAAFTIIGPPNLNTSAKVSSSAGGKVMPGEVVTYTITLSNTGGVDTQVVVTDVLGSYYNIYNELDFTEPTSSTLTWSGTVKAGQQIALRFSVQVVTLDKLKSGITTLANSVTIDDNINTPFLLADSNPPYVEVKVIYLPLVFRNSP
ncbi:MAG: ExeM/NucH family extracellular endonuclease, partial [Chloroflexota bacterium]|nr:ExeM/NucH family extracellular endonuclease [Chloroflexota bacterium]